MLIKNKLYLQGITESDYTITDITGRQLQKGHITQQTSANVSGLPQGMYLIYLNDVSKTLKFSKQ